MLVITARRLAIASRATGSRFASTTSQGLAQKQKLVVLGSGWGGYNVARAVDKKLYDVTVVSPNSYFSFTPFLASTAVGTLEFRCATEPVRGIRNVRFAQGWANKIDFANRKVQVEPALPPVDESHAHRPKGADEHVKVLPADQRMGLYDVDYDKLVISVGCYAASFGIPGVSKHAHFLKDIRDARAIRKRVLYDVGFSVVGGGPTGVEFAAELHDFIQDDVYRMMPELKGQVKIRVYDVAPGLLMSFDKNLRAYAEEKFTREGVEARPNSKITAVGPDWIELDGKTREPHGLLVWSTGLSANPLMQSMEGVTKDEKTQSLRVNDQLTVLDAHGNAIEGVFAIGDNAMPMSGHLPATAQVASQMASYATKLLNKAAGGADVSQEPAFKWKNKGSMVLIGDNQGILDRSQESISGPRSRMAGYAAWFVWRSYYMTLAMGWRNKILVPVHWALTFFFGRDVTRF